MAYQANDKSDMDLMEQLIDQGLDGLPEVITTLINHAMELERRKHLQASPYERTDQRQGYANGYKPKQLKTRLGKLNLQIPQTRGSDFYPSCFERGMRSERALKLAVAEMYFQGISTRKVKKVMEELCGFEITSSEVSNAAKLLDDELSKWRNRPLGNYPYVYLDAQYEKVRYAGQVRDCAILIAVGVDNTGHRDILGLSVSLSEVISSLINFTFLLILFLLLCQEYFFSLMKLILHRIRFYGRGIWKTYERGDYTLMIRLTDLSLC